MLVCPKQLVNLCRVETAGIAEDVADSALRFFDGLAYLVVLMERWALGACGSCVGNLGGQLVGHTHVQDGVLVPLLRAVGRVIVGGRVRAVAVI